MGTDTGLTPQINGITQEIFVKAWVDALESGNYIQSTSRLTINGGYCCMGVACLVAEYLGIPGSNIFEQKTQYAPNKWFYDLVGMEEGRSNVKGESFTEMNDAYGLSFMEIAAKIRGHFPQYFSTNTPK